MYVCMYVCIYIYIHTHISDKQGPTINTHRTTNKGRKAQQHNKINSAPDQPTTMDSHKHVTSDRYIK